MQIDTPRFVLRDFRPADRAVFVGYQTDPRYRTLYGIEDADGKWAEVLFDSFRDWQREEPRRNRQLGIFERSSTRLCGCAGLRESSTEPDVAALGIELTPDDWGRYRLAIEVAAALVQFGFRDLSLRRIIGDTASGNRRVERLARWFGAEIVARRPGPDWMAARGWDEVEWALDREAWELGRRRAGAQWG